MSDYYWCHGPECHIQQTQYRLRGSGRDIVLRTIKVKVNNHNQYGNSIFDYFCNTRCLYDYLGKYAQAISAIAPRREAQETPITVEKTKSQEYRMRYNGNDYDKVPYISTRTTIKSVDNDNG